MSAYTLHDWNTGIAVLGVLATLVVLGFALTRGRKRAGWWRGAAWCLPVAGFVIVERLTATEPAGVRMIAICLAILWGMKGVVGVESRLSGDAPLGPVAWLAFCVGWFGMRPAVFVSFPGPPRDGVRELLCTSARAAGMGIGFLVLAMWVVPADGNGVGLRTMAGVVLLMIALSLLVHFALFDLLAAVWRSLGANTRKLFRRPIASRSLTEFWGRRWNLAFSEMAALAVHRPLKGVVGAGVASVAAFLFSGLLHELAISVPVGAGYGLPFVYFVLHAFAMQCEGRRLGSFLEARPWLGRVWTMAWIVLPMPLLFHGAFTQEILLPIVDSR